jgi:hypothetical protein
MNVYNEDSPVVNLISLLLSFFLIGLIINTIPSSSPLFVQVVVEHIFFDHSIQKQCLLPHPRPLLTKSTVVVLHVVRGTFVLALGVLVSIVLGR